MVDDDRELAMKIAKKGTAERWVGMVHAIASGGGLHNSGTGSRVTTCYQVLLREWNKGKRKNRVPVPA
jgi:agmatine/peptidylarginine deiminase